TLLASLNHIVKPEINVLTVEDRVEYLIPGVRQIKIGTKNNVEQALRSILRHDPDVVMVGEIRDKETAEIAIKLANTGHLTFSTLHTNDAPSAISRMYKMGLETFLLAYAINIIVAQRLIRKLCERCKRPMSNLDPVIPLSLGFTNAEVAATTFYEAVGCQACQHGYKGRIAIHEAMYISQEIRSIIFSAGKDIDEEAIRKQAIKNGMLTLRASARERVKTGVTTLEEMARSTAEDN
ncbi:MAG: Flp pilus assembly complex ATPase component TadA, partial [Calditrichaeota bacterium]|nr:Flp pilus assembly complex ATPase component TadA [Calditrichota bacterium]